LRRQMYLSDIKRQQAEGEFTGPKEEFLATLGMQVTIAPALLSLRACPSYLEV